MDDVINILNTHLVETKSFVEVMILTNDYANKQATKANLRLVVRKLSSIIEFLNHS